MAERTTRPIGNRVYLVGTIEEKFRQDGRRVVGKISVFGQSGLGRKSVLSIRMREANAAQALTLDPGSVIRVRGSLSQHASNRSGHREVKQVLWASTVEPTVSDPTANSVILTGYVSYVDFYEGRGGLGNGNLRTVLGLQVSDNAEIMNRVNISFDDTDITKQIMGKSSAYFPEEHRIVPGDLVTVTGFLRETYDSGIQVSGTKIEYEGTNRDEQRTDYVPVTLDDEGNIIEKKTSPRRTQRQAPKNNGANEGKNDEIIPVVAAKEADEFDGYLETIANELPEDNGSAEIVTGKTTAIDMLTSASAANPET